MKNHWKNFIYTLVILLGICIATSIAAQNDTKESNLNNSQKNELEIELSERLNFALTEAILKNDIKEIKHLLAIKVDLNLAREFPSLIAAIVMNNKDIVDILINSGVKVNPPIYHKCPSPLEAAIIMGHTELVTQLIAYGAKLTTTLDDSDEIKKTNSILAVLPLILDDD